jgi:predicted Zn-dependent protease
MDKPTCRPPLTATFLAALALVAAVALAAVPVARAEANPAAPAPSGPAVDAELLAKGSALAYERELARVRETRTLNLDKTQVSYARRIAAPLITRAGDLFPAAQAWQWGINVETRGEVVAWCLPGGEMLVSSALFERGKYQVAEIAAILAHAMAHELLGHDAAEAGVRFAAHRDAASPDPNRRLLTVAEILAGLARRDAYSADQERAADTVALRLLARSGYDPKALATVMSRQGGARDARAPAYAALHPGWPERVAEIEAQLPAAVAAYEKELAERTATTPPPRRGNIIPRQPGAGRMTPKEPRPQ